MTPKTFNKGSPATPTCQPVTSSPVLGEGTTSKLIENTVKIDQNVNINLIRNDLPMDSKELVRVKKVIEKKETTFKNKYL